VKTNTGILSSDYAAFVTNLKSRIASAHLTAARAVNRELILLYWDIGQAIVEKQTRLGWGESVVEVLSSDLRREFPDMTGFSARNLWDMRRFFEVYGSPEILRQAAAEFGDAVLRKRFQLPKDASHPRFITHFTTPYNRPTLAW
jgi:hypothetical protein